MNELYEQFGEEWKEVKKNDDHRVERESFCKYLFDKHEHKLSDDATKGEYKKFLDKNFDCCRALMLPKDKDSLGRHCFTYGNLMAGEFYFAAAEKDMVYT